VGTPPVRLRRQGQAPGCIREYLTACPPRDNKHTRRLDWAAQTASLSTTDGRQVVPFSVPVYAARYAGGSPDSADLILRRRLVAARGRDPAEAGGGTDR